jgi:hypothetical protein
MIYEQLQAVEVFSLVFSLAALAIMMGVCWKARSRCLHLFLIGYFSLVVGIFFTNIESALFPRAFNLLEHIFRVLVPSIVFVKVSYDISKKR